MREARARPRRGGWTCRRVSARRRRVPEVAATGRSIPRGPTAPAGGDSGGSWPAETVRGSGSLAQSPPPTRQAGPVASPGGAPKHLPPPPPNQEAPRCGVCCRGAVPAAVRPGVLAPRGGATGPASAVHPDASWPSRPARRPLPPAPRSGIPVTARSKTCQGIFRFKRRKNIPTGDRAALGLREIPDPKNLK